MFRFLFIPGRGFAHVCSWLPYWLPDTEELGHSSPDRPDRDTTIIQEITQRYNNHSMIKLGVPEPILLNRSNLYIYIYGAYLVVEGRDVKWCVS